jgi:hypothetical protein
VIEILLNRIIPIACDSEFLPCFFFEFSICLIDLSLCLSLFKFRAISFFSLASAREAFFEWKLRLQNAFSSFKSDLWYIGRFCIFFLISEKEYPNFQKLEETVSETL